MKLRIKISGPRVHDVGYRVFLLKYAMNLALPGFSAYNWEEYDQQQVIVLVEGDESRLAAFRKVVEEKKPEFAEISGTLFEEYDGDIGRIGDFAMLCSFVQLDKAIPILLSMDNKMGQMLEKQDNSIGELRDLRVDLIKRSDDRLARIEKDIRAIKSKIGLR